MNPTERNSWLAKNILVHERALRVYLQRFFQNVADIADVEDVAIPQRSALRYSSRGQRQRRCARN